MLLKLDLFNFSHEREGGQPLSCAGQTEFFVMHWIAGKLFPF